MEGSAAPASGEDAVIVIGAGAAGLAAAMKNKERFAGQTVCIVLSGGNADPALFAEILSGDAQSL